jgi:hypothetical protein
VTEELFAGFTTDQTPLNGQTSSFRHAMVLTAQICMYDNPIPMAQFLMKFADERWKQIAISPQ